LPSLPCAAVDSPVDWLGGPPLAKLERALRFQEVAKIEFGGQLAALFVAATLACADWESGLRSRATRLAIVCAAGCKEGIELLATPHRRLGAGAAHDRLRLGFSASVRVWQLRNLVNPLIVGRFLGTEAVAFVALAVRAVEALSFVRTAVGRVAIAALARLRENPERCQRMMQKGARLQLFALGPVFVLLCVLGPPLLPGLLADAGLRRS